MKFLLYNLKFLASFKCYTKNNFNHQIYLKELIFPVNVLNILLDGDIIIKRRLTHALATKITDY